MILLDERIVRRNIVSRNIQCHAAVICTGRVILRNIFIVFCEFVTQSLRHFRARFIRQIPDVSRAVGIAHPHSRSHEIVTRRKMKAVLNVVCVTIIGNIIRQIFARNVYLRIFAVTTLNICTAALRASLAELAAFAAILAIIVKVIRRNRAVNLAVILSRNTKDEEAVEFLRNILCERVIDCRAVKRERALLRH